MCGECDLVVASVRQAEVGEFDPRSPYHARICKRQSNPVQNRWSNGHCRFESCCEHRGFDSHEALHLLDDASFGSREASSFGVRRSFQDVVRLLVPAARPRSSTYCGFESRQLYLRL
jgi:hypothetical protein